LQQNGLDQVVVDVCSMHEDQPLQMTGLQTYAIFETCVHIVKYWSTFHMRKVVVIFHSRILWHCIITAFWDCEQLPQLLAVL